MVQLAFEECNVPGFYASEGALMSLFGVGLTTGLVVDIGHETTGEFF